MSAKKLPPPSGTADLTELLRSRRAGGARPTPVIPDPPPARPVTQSRSSAMDRRSWYMPADSAAALVAAVEDLHFATRQPKHAVLAALIAVALEHQDEARQRLRPE